MIPVYGKALAYNAFNWFDTKHYVNIFNKRSLLS